MEKSVGIVEVKGRKIGGERPQVCMPLVARTEQQLMREAEAILAAKPDIVEWRADFLDEVENIPAVVRLLNNLRNKLNDYPIIFTCRIDQEGGYRKIEENLRFELIKKVIQTRQVDIVDIELINGEEKIKEILEAAKKNGIYIILSNHDFEKTPPVETIVERLIKAQELGADIAKIAVMPNSTADVLNLLYATNIVKEKHVQIPLITISMSEKGLISRIAGGMFGSSVTFGAGKQASAPGQISVSELKSVLEILHKNK